MLIQCVECSREISDQAAACPHCGCPQGRAGAVPPGDAITPASKKKAAPIFLSLAVIAVFVSGGAPRFLAFIPIMCILGFSVVSMVRKERGSSWALLTLLLGLFIWGLSSTDFSQSTSQHQATQNAEQSARIVSSRWVKDPNFGTRGTIKWYVEVENISSRYIRMAEVEFTTYDAAGKIVSSSTTYVNAIPPGGRGTDDSYADYYRTEATAGFRLKRVYFE